jgi:copper chaperone CopZ
MHKLSFNVGTIFCYDCVMALRRFIGSMKGVVSVEVEEGNVSVQFDPSVTDEETVSRIVKDNVERLGYKILD